MRERADAAGITSIAMPRIGAGYGGLSWRKVKEIVEQVFADWPGTLTVYQEYAPETDTEAVAGD
jgi:O-acetyl-ADP-ribose deacetylase (regulator of RNase III)